MAGHSPWGHKESDPTECTRTHMIKAQVSFGKVMSSSLSRKKGLYHYLGGQWDGLCKTPTCPTNICFLLLYYKLFAKIIYINICVSVCMYRTETQNGDLEQRTENGDLNSGDLKTTEYTLASLIAMIRFQTMEYK